MVRRFKTLAVVAVTLVIVFGFYSPSAQLSRDSRVQFVGDVSDRILDLLQLAFRIKTEGLESSSDTTRSPGEDSSKAATDGGSNEASRLIQEAANSLIEWVYLVQNCADCAELPDEDCGRLINLRSEFSNRIDSLESILPCKSPTEKSHEPLYLAYVSLDSISTMLDTFLALECSK